MAALISVARSLRPLRTFVKMILDLSGSDMRQADGPNPAVKQVAARPRPARDLSGRT